MTDDQEDQAELDAGVDEWVEEYLLAVVDEEEVSLDEYCKRIADEVLRSQFRSRALAEEYLWRIAEGEQVPVSEYLHQLPEGEERDEFLQICRDSRLADRLLPGNLTPGCIFGGRYVIQGEIGRGGMGVVYSAMDRELEREVALKVFNYEALAGNQHEWEEYVLKESKALASLESRNIVTVYDAKRGQHESFIVMDRIRGTDLFSVLDEVRTLMTQETVATGSSRKRPALLEMAVGADPEGERKNLFVAGDWYRTVAKIMSEIAFTIELAHDKGVVHRDIKSTNILLVSGGEPVLLDFGLAAGMSGSFEDEGFRGTPEYIAPEQARNMTTGTDPRTDIYQLGLVLYEFLTLQQAYTRRGDEELLGFLTRISDGKAVPPSFLDPKVPTSLNAICRKAMARELPDRYESARQLRVDLERFSAGLPPVHAEVPRGHAAWLRARYVARNPVTRSLAAALLVFLGITALIPEKWYPPASQETYFQRLTDEELVTSTGKAFVEYDGGKAWLGMKLVVNSPSFLYTFGIYEDAENQRHIFPTNASIYPERPSTGDPVPLQVSEDAVIVCNTIQEPDPYEGFLAYATRQPSGMLEQLQLDLNRYVDLHGTGMPYSYFERRIDEFLSEARGERVIEFTEEEMAVLFKERAPETDETDELWRNMGIKPFEHLIRVVRPGQDTGSGAEASAE